MDVETEVRMVWGRGTRKFQTVNVADFECERKRPQDGRRSIQELRVAQIISAEFASSDIVLSFSFRPFVSRVLRPPFRISSFKSDTHPNSGPYFYYSIR